ncbi:MAG TPA: YciI family protein [Gammaproteobacteria bacterium]|nr:YciI family protein [Gammaproteobacteria bacterium]
MKYLCLIYLSRENWHACEDHVCARYAEEVARSGRLLAAEPLHGADTATTVRVRNGETLVTDGPFAETKELLAGFYLVEARDLNEALLIAAKIPPARYGSVEVRPVRELDVTESSKVS